MSSKNNDMDQESKEHCFVIMPISDEVYSPGHFKRVYEDIFRPACEKSGYEAIRADDIYKANFIQLDIIQRLLDTPMAICDLSTRNPNVLYELGMRQAFDMPTVLVQEIDTPKIFDINIFRYVEYDSKLDYRSVLKAQDDIAKAISETKGITKGKDINSLVKLIGLEKAKVKQLSKEEIPDINKYVLDELKNLRASFNNYFGRLNKADENSVIYKIDSIHKGVTQLEALIKDNVSKQILQDLYHSLDREWMNVSGIQEMPAIYRSILNDLRSKLGGLNMKLMALPGL